MQINNISPHDNSSCQNNICCVVIPIYKNELSEHETASLKQCCNILGKYPIFFVTHNKLDCSFYDIICNNMGVSFKYEYFHEHYFHNILGYNALMISKSFYKRFFNYNYMLVYQLDAYVFKDELEYWCKKGYDYIGAPWLKLDNSKTMPEFKTPAAVGNGGFSLRNIKTSIKKHTIKFSILSFMYLFQSYYNKISLKPKGNFCYFILRLCFRFLLLIFKFLISIFLNSGEIYTNEDILWCHLFQKKGNIPHVLEAMKFAFECFPEYLYKINNKELPFGCHAWFDYQNYPFYKEYIS